MLNLFFSLSNKKKLKSFIHKCHDSKIVKKFFNLENTRNKIYLYTNKLFFSKCGAKSEFYPITLVTIPWKYEDQNDSLWVIGYFVESHDSVFSENFCILLDITSLCVYTNYILEINSSNLELLEYKFDIFLTHLTDPGDDAWWETQS